MSKFLKTMAVMWVGVLIAFLLFLSAAFGMIGRLAGDGLGLKEKRPHITVLKVEGAIMGSETLMESISRISQDKACKGVLLRIDSPGGAVGASQEIYSALKVLKSKPLPIVVSQGNLAASGGYYVSLAGDKIFSNPGTLTGSIGVLFQFPGAQKLLDKIGVGMYTVKSGPLKDVGNFAREPTKDELRYLQTLIDNTFEQFLGDILANRKISRDSLLRIADGRILTGQQARLHGLIDTLGGFQEAKSYLAKLVKLDGEPVVVEEPPSRSWIENALESASQGSLNSFSRAAKSLLPMTREGAYYLWR